jgi:rhodanese-related sulfurtransferase
MISDYIKIRRKRMKQQINYYATKLDYEMDPADLFEALNHGEKVVAVDARRTEGFTREHIPGAINLPHRSMNEETTRHLDRNTLYVAYCDGIGCNASTRGALNLARLGFKVKELIGGIEWWKFDGYATEGAHPSKEGRRIACAC